jgi:hypothetical protein
MGKHGPHGSPARCSFCGEDQRRVKRLIAGPGVYICNNCVSLCNEVLDEDLGSRPGSGWRATTSQQRRGAISRLRCWLRELLQTRRVYPASSSSSTSLS